MQTDSRTDRNTDTDAPAIAPNLPPLPYRRTVEIGDAPHGGSVFAEIEIRQTGKGPELSISGTYPGGGGQIRDAVRDITALRPGWTPAIRDRFLAIWDAWHLNGMRAGCAHQTGAGWDASLKIGGKYAGHVYQTEHPDGILCKPCPVCGYQYGSAWLYVPLPADIVAEILAWPSGGIEPGPDGRTPDSYDLQADRWLQASGVTFEAEHAQKKPAPWGPKGARAGDNGMAQHWRVTLRAPSGAGVRPLSFDFWNSQADTEAGIPLRPYTVLACLSDDRQYTDADDAADAFGGVITLSQARRIAAWGLRISRWIDAVDRVRPGMGDQLGEIS